MVGGKKRDMGFIYKAHSQNIEMQAINDKQQKGNLQKQRT